MSSAHRMSLLSRAEELGIQGRHKMNIGTLSQKIRDELHRRDMEQLCPSCGSMKSNHVPGGSRFACDGFKPGPKPAVLRCSACGSDAEHHVEYVAVHGLCVA